MTTIAKVTKLPACDFAPCAAPAEYDFKTWMGPWAFGCSEHYMHERKYMDLGLGKGQKLEVIS